MGCNQGVPLGLEIQGNPEHEHALQRIHRPSPVRWYCNSCGAISKLEQRYRCPHPSCDFDLCDACMELNQATSKATEPEEPEAALGKSSKSEDEEMDVGDEGSIEQTNLKTAGSTSSMPNRPKQETLSAANLERATSTPIPSLARPASSASVDSRAETNDTKRSMSASLEARKASSDDGKRDSLSSGAFRSYAEEAIGGRSSLASGVGSRAFVQEDDSRDDKTPPAGDKSPAEDNKKEEEEPASVYEVGARLQLTGLKNSADLNGQIVVITASVNPNDKDAKYRATIERDGRDVNVKAINLKPIGSSGVTPADLTIGL